MGAGRVDLLGKIGKTTGGLEANPTAIRCSQDCAATVLKNEKPVASVATLVKTEIASNLEILKI
jgi:hypothetical protein